MSLEIMIADDHGMMREGIRHLLEFNGYASVVAEAKDGTECLSVLNSLSDLPDVLLLDINMPNQNGIEVLQEIRNKKMKLKVLMLTVHNEVEYLLKAIDIGADGYLLKDSGFEDLQKAITAVMEGNEYIQPSLIPALNARLVKRDTDKEKIESLTKRELEVLILVANGMFNKEIALHLNISERTVKNHLSSIFKKIDVADRTQAAVFVIRNGLIQLH